MAKKIRNPHDRFMKALLSDIEMARDYFTQFLPEPLKAIVNLSGLSHSGTSFISGVEEGHFNKLLEEIPKVMKTAFVSTADKIRQKGIHQTKKQAVQNMLRKGFERSLICDIQEVTPEFVEQVRKEMEA